MLKETYSNRQGLAATALTPLRISLAGGGTDLPEYSEAFGGEVVAMAITPGVRVSMRAAPGTTSISWRDGGGPLAGHPRLDALAAELADEYCPTGAWRLTSVADARAGAGLGSSGAFLVALAACLRPLDDPAELARIAFGWERTRAGRTVGPQDSFASANGGLSRIRIGRDGDVAVEPAPLHARSRAWINANFLLFDTGGTRDASQVALRSLEAGDADRTAALHRIRELTGPFREALATGDVDRFGPLLTSNWQLKTGLGAGISTPRAERLLADCLAAGATGGKLVGAGGGGYVLVSVPPAAVAEVRTAMVRAGAAELPFEISDAGVRREPDRRANTAEPDAGTPGSE